MAKEAELHREARILAEPHDPAEAVARTEQEGAEGQQQPGGAVPEGRGARETRGPLWF